MIDVAVSSVESAELEKQMKASHKFKSNDFNVGSINMLTRPKDFIRTVDE